MKENNKLAGVKVTTPPFRLAFEHVYKPHLAPQAKEPKFSIRALFPKTGKPLKELNGKTPEQFLKGIAKQAAAEAWGKDPKKWPKINWPFKDGDEKSDYSGHEGHFFINADSNQAPELYSRDAQRLDAMDDRTIYAGCYARARLTCKATPNVAGKNYVKFYLNGVMFWADGEQFGGGDSGAEFAKFAESEGGNDDLDTGADDDEIDLGF